MDADREEQLQLSAAEASEGCTKLVRFSRRIVCAACGGGGGGGCAACASGFVEREEAMELVVRPHTTAGARISVLGKGDQRLGAPSGNRYFVVAIDGQPAGAAHPYRSTAGPKREDVPIVSRSGLPAIYVFAGVSIGILTLLIALSYVSR